jgi:hypothetical protein
LKSEGASRDESKKKFSPKNNLQSGILDMTVDAQEMLKMLSSISTKQ